MGYNIVVSTRAIEDTSEAYTFYEGQQEGLGKLKHHLTWYSFVFAEETIRALTLKIFPYKIIYEINADEVYTFAIHHFRQNPDHFLKRL